MSELILDHHHACTILGVGDGTDLQKVKTAYKALLKKYHPDVTGDNSAMAIERYELINQAYEFLVEENEHRQSNIYNERLEKVRSELSGEIRKRGPQIVGGNSYNGSSGADYAAFEKKYQKRKREKKQEFIKKQEELARKRKKDQEDYDRVMRAVDAIRTARALEALIRASEDRK